MAFKGCLRQKRGKIYEVCEVVKNGRIIPTVCVFAKQIIFGSLGVLALQCRN